MDEVAAAFTIAFVPGVTLTRWTRAWQERQRRIPLAFLSADAASQISALHDGRADVSFVRLPVDRTGLSIIPLYDEVAVVTQTTAVNPKPIDALFTDIRLKRASQGGLEVANQAIKLRPKLRVLYTTSFSATDELKSLFVDGAHFLSKPYAPCDLQASVERLLARAGPLAA